MKTRYIWLLIIIVALALWAVGATGWSAYQYVNTP